MCFYTQNSKSAKALQDRFNAPFKSQEPYLPFPVLSGFQHPQMPVITNLEPNFIQMFSWGLLPAWSKDRSFQKNTLNARMETLSEKPSFRGVLKNRCLVLADGFYEWKWLDPKGKSKQTYKITLPCEEPFGFAGLWSEWIDKETGELIPTCTIITTEANELMSEIHNTKKRMPVIVARDSESDWLDGKKLQMQNHLLEATPVSL